MATYFFIIEIKNYCQLMFHNYVSCLLHSEYNKDIHMIKLCVSGTIKSIKQIVKVQNDVIFIVQKWDNWL